MEFTKLTVLSVSEEVQSATGFTFRVYAAIGTAPVNGLPLTAKLGSQPLESLGIEQSLQPLLSGYLRTAPQVGDELVIQIGSVTIPTGLTVEDPAIG
jgi:hypothetical protein